MLEPAYGWIDAMLREDLTAPRKHRHTSARICQRLASEYGFTECGRTTIYSYVARRRPEIVAEAREGRTHLEGMVPQLHLPGEEAEVLRHRDGQRLTHRAPMHLVPLRQGANRDVRLQPPITTNACEQLHARQRQLRPPTRPQG